MQTSMRNKFVRQPRGRILGPSRFCHQISIYCSILFVWSIDQMGKHNDSRLVDNVDNTEIGGIDRKTGALLISFWRGHGTKIGLGRYSYLSVFLSTLLYINPFSIKSEFSRQLLGCAIRKLDIVIKVMKFVRWLVRVHCLYECWCAGATTQIWTYEQRDESKPDTSRHRHRKTYIAFFPSICAIWSRSNWDGDRQVSNRWRERQMRN